jgi:hypothetical protein
MGIRDSEGGRKNHCHSFYASLGEGWEEKRKKKRGEGEGREEARVRE